MDRLEGALRSTRGVVEARIDRKRTLLELTIDPALTGLEVVEAGARAAGVELSRKFRHARFAVNGLDCMDCAAKIEHCIGQMPGVVWCQVSFATMQMQVEYEADRTEPAKLMQRVRELGYDVVVEGESLHVQQNRRMLFTALSGVLLLAASLLPLSESASTILLAASVGLGGWMFMRTGLAAARLLTVDTNLLMGVAAVGAALLGQWHEAALVAFLYSLGTWLEGFALHRNRRALEDLVRMAPRQATRLRGDVEELVEVHALGLGELVRLRPWERVPVDLRLVRGQSYVDQASLTGEAEPVLKAAGDELLSGVVNGNGMLEGVVIRPHGQDTLSQVIELIREAQSQKAPSQTFSERFGRVYSPMVMGTSILLALYGALLAPHAAPWLERALTLLVVACPCALVIATPVAIASALARAARMGVLVKGGAHLEALGGCQVMVFDKTGTLSTGRFSVMEKIPVGPHDEQSLLEAASRAAGNSDHPVARAVLEHLKERGLPTPRAERVEAFPGLGLETEHEGVRHHLGRAAFLAERGYDVAPHEGEFVELAAKGHAVVGVGRNGRLVGLLGLVDEPRRHAAEAVERLQKMGVSPLVMLTGDHAGTALALARHVGIHEVRAGLLPGQKSEAVGELAARHGPVAMVGDGVNDAPALARATVGIAIGSAGNGVAMETADIVIMGSDLRTLPEMLALARRTSRTIRQNVAISLAAVAGMLLFASTGALALSGAVIAHEGSALIVILNGLRLLAGPRTAAATGAAGKQATV
jgi:Cd2+/Zn2+-exporting ATPase